MDHEKTYKGEQGMEMEIRIKAECLTDENICKTLSFIAQSSHRFYLEVAEKINNKL